MSFDEFMEGLFQHGTTPTPSVTPRPHSTPRLREKLRLTLEDRALSQTPSFMSSGLTLLSQLNEENSGYASADAIIELWEKNGILHGTQILEYLQFDANTKINLNDLSYAMEQELKTTEEDNATYQAAITSYQIELLHLKVIEIHD